MPTRERSFGRSFFIVVTFSPSTMMVPCCTGSSAFTVLISVDLPDPEGPQTTTTSPFSTAVVQFFSTWNCGLYHLLTFSMVIMGMMSDR
jgi:hypothetical protein